MADCPDKFILPLYPISADGPNILLRLLDRIQWGLDLSQLLTRCRDTGPGTLTLN